jgi:hypothetical protein
VTYRTPAEEPPEVVVGFLPLHKLATGMAVGTVSALVVVVLTVDAMFRPPGNRLPMELLAVYFSGYTVSWAGVAIGAWWAWFSGFVAGWFLAFVRNFALACQIVLLRTRANLAQTRDFLDHI